MTARLFEAASNIIRNRPQVSEWRCEEIVADAAQLDKAHVLHWLDSMADHVDLRQMQHLHQTAHTVSVTTVFKIEPLIISVKLAGLLRAGSGLNKVVQHVGELLGYSLNWLIGNSF